MPAAEPADQLRAAGLRVTAARVAVLGVLGELRHVGTDAVARAVRERVGTVSTQGVYDVLAALVRAGLVRRIEPPGSPALFERRAGDNHHHLICRSCGAVEDVDCAAGHAPCLEPSSGHGFALDEAEVIWWGRCPSCQAPAQD